MAITDAGDMQNFLTNSVFGNKSETALAGLDGAVHDTRAASQSKDSAALRSAHRRRCYLEYAHLGDFAAAAGRPKPALWRTPPLEEETSSTRTASISP